MVRLKGNKVVAARRLRRELRRLAPENEVEREMFLRHAELAINQALKEPTPRLAELRIESFLLKWSHK